MQASGNLEKLSCYGHLCLASRICHPASALGRSMILWLKFLLRCILIHKNMNTGLQISAYMCTGMEM